MRKHTIIKNIFKYSLSQYFSKFLGFFTAILIRRFLGPYNMGILAILKMVTDYAGHTHLGTTNAISYKIPYYIGQGNREEAEKIKNIVLSFIGITSFLSSIAVLLFALIFRNSLEPDIFTGLVTVSVVILAQRFYTYYVMLLRANKEFAILGRSIIFDALINLVLVLAIVSGFKLKGMFLVLILMPILNMIYIHFYVRYPFTYKIVLSKLLSYIRFGFPLFIQAFLVMILNSVDRIMIAKMLGLQQLGYYSIALMARTYNLGIAHNFNIVLIPYFMEDFGKSKDIKEVSKYVVKPTLIISYFMIVLLGMTYIVVPLLVRYILPDFVPGIMSMQIFLITTFFACLLPAPTKLLVAAGKQMKLVLIAFLVLLLNIVLNYMFIRLGYGISGVALSTAIATFLCYLITLSFAMKHFENFLNITLFIIKTLVPLLYGAIILQVLDMFIIFQSDIVGAIIKIILFIGLMAPLFFYLQVKTRIISDVIYIIKERLNRGK